MNDEFLETPCKDGDSAIPQLQLSYFHGNTYIAHLATFRPYYQTNTLFLRMVNPAKQSMAVKP